jgi:hypothetical protein
VLGFTTYQSKAMNEQSEDCVQGDKGKVGIASIVPMLLKQSDQFSLFADAFSAFRKTPFDDAPNFTLVSKVIYHLDQ